MSCHGGKSCGESCVSQGFPWILHQLTEPPSKALLCSASDTCVTQNPAGRCSTWYEARLALPPASRSQHSCWDSMPSRCAPDCVCSLIFQSTQRTTISHHSVFLTLPSPWISELIISLPIATSFSFAVPSLGTVAPRPPGWSDRGL